MQLVTAARCGLAVPVTAITNDPAAARAFATTGEHGAVIKALGGVSITEEGRRKVGLTHRLTDNDLHNLDGFDVTCHQLQHWQTKRCDVRVVVIGDHITAVAIHAGNDASHVDWRADYNSLSYELVEAPTDVANGIRALMHALGLVYGALDFVVGPDDQWTFLEINPGGQYGWLETATGAPLTDTLATLLAAGATQ